MILPGVVARVVGRSLVGRGDRHGFVDGLWIELKRYGARSVESIPLSRIRGIDQISVQGPVVRQGTLIVSALAELLECDRVFDFGASDGETAWILARNLPTARIYAFGAEPVARGRDARSRDNRITLMQGNSATFDFSPYEGVIDLVHIDCSQRRRLLIADTAAAFGMLSELGAIVWYGYAYNSEVYAYLNALGAHLDHPILHILGTRLALYSRWDIVVGRS
jgi:hypothetical protein